MDLNSGDVVDRYTIDQPIGRGGMAIVYRARHNQLGTIHAIKVLTVGASSIKKRLLQEGRAQATLSHPNIVNVTDVIDVGGSPGLVMEIIDGPSMDDFLQQVKLSFDQVDELAQGVIAGVAEAHRHGLIHRDLKPANVMLKVTARGFVPKVTDFGLAKALGDTGSGGAKTRSGAVMGTPYYMAPEQIRDSKNVDQRADIFSLGAMLYEMVAGERPFEREDILETYTAIASGDYVPLDMKVPGCPERFVKAVHGALMVKVDDRIADCDTLLAMWTGKEAVRGDDGKAVAAGPWSADMINQARSLRPKSTGGGDSRPSSPSGGDQTWQPDDPTSGRHKSVSAETLSRKNTGGGTAAVGNVSVMYQEKGFPSAKQPSMSRSKPPSFSPSSGSTSLSQAPAEKPSRMPMFLGIAIAVGGLGLGAAGLGLGLYASMGGDDASGAAVAAEAPVVAPVVTPPVEAPPAEVEAPEPVVEAPPAEVVPAEPVVAAPAEVPKAKVTPKAPKAPTKAAEAPKAAAGPGTLVVNSKPWSDLVTIDGTPAQNTPYKTPIAAGKHKVSLHANDGRTYEGTVEVTTDQTTTFCWDFDQGAMCQR